MRLRLVSLCAVLLVAGGVLCEPLPGGGEPPANKSADGAEAEERYGNTPANLVPYSRTESSYRHFYLTPPLHRGPGRDKPEPIELTSVRIGLFAPLEGGGNRGPDLLRGVKLALDRVNAADGYAGLPFELIERNDQALWGSSANTLVELAYEDRVWALIGSIDSNSTHVALRAALKAELPIVNVGSTDPTMTETGIPWIVRVNPDDRQTGYRLASLLFEERGFSRIAVLRSSDRYGRFGIKEFRDAARRLGRPIPLEILFVPGQQEFALQLERVAGSEIEAVVLWADTPDAARIVRQMRRHGLSQPVFGTDRMASPDFLRLAGNAAEGVQAVCWMNPERAGADWTVFQRRFRSRYGTDPGPYAAYGYDAAMLVADAVQRAGLNRARIRDLLTGLRSYQGVVGRVRLDATSNNISQLQLARVEGGRFVFD